MPAKTCQYANCLNDVGENGVVVSLRKPTFDDEHRAIYCCAAHAAAALARLTLDREETAAPVPTRWRCT